MFKRCLTLFRPRLQRIWLEKACGSSFLDQSALELLAVKYNLASAYVTRALSTTGFLRSDTPVLLYLQNEVQLFMPYDCAFHYNRNRKAIV